MNEGFESIALAESVVKIKAEAVGFVEPNALEYVHPAAVDGGILGGLPREGD